MLAVGFGLWTTQAWAWMFSMIVAGLSLFGAFLYFVNYPGSGIGFGMSLMPLIIIWYLNSAEVKSAFGLDIPPAG